MEGVGGVGGGRKMEQPTQLVHGTLPGPHWMNNHLDKSSTTRTSEKAKVWVAAVSGQLFPVGGRGGSPAVLLLQPAAGPDHRYVAVRASGHP